MDEIFEKLFVKLYARHGVKTITIGKAINITDAVCDVTREGLPELKGVRIHSIEDNLQSWIRVKPKEGSYVLCGIIENDPAEAVIIATSEIDEVDVKIGDSSFNINQEGYQVHRDGDSLKEVIQLIIEATQQVLVLYGNNPDYGKLTTATQKLNNVLR